jgi:hypothetical protein
MTKSETGRARPVSQFLTKTWDLCSNGAHDEIVGWSRCGTSFEIRNVYRFAEHVLPAYFKHSNHSTFVRQLNMYGFAKVTVPAAAHCYRHEHFVRRDKARLALIRRKAGAGVGKGRGAKRSRNSSAAANDDGDDDGDDDDDDDDDDDGGDDDGGEGGSTANAAGSSSGNKHARICAPRLGAIETSATQLATRVDHLEDENLYLRTQIAVLEETHHGLMEVVQTLRAHVVEHLGQPGGFGRLFGHAGEVSAVATAAAAAARAHPSNSSSSSSSSNNNNNHNNHNDNNNSAANSSNAGAIAGSSTPTSPVDLVPEVAGLVAAVTPADAEDAQRTADAAHLKKLAEIDMYFNFNQPVHHEHPHEQEDPAAQLGGEDQGNDHLVPF